MKFSIPRGDNKVKDEIFRPATAEFHATRPFHGSEMGISIQYDVILIRQLNDQILMRCYINR